MFVTLLVQTVKAQDAKLEPVVLIGLPFLEEAPQLEERPLEVEQSALKETPQTMHHLLNLVSHTLF